MDESTRRAAEEALGYSFRDPKLLECALTHASLADLRENSNERMEFLGDAVLGLVVCESVYARYPRMLEGEMTKIKSLAVSREMCARLAREMELPGMLSMGKGMQNGVEIPMSLAAAALEAVIAAVYIDGGFDAAKSFLRPRLDPVIDEAAASRHQQNYKSYLQQHAQQNRLESPQYRVLDEQGPDHAKCFKVGVEMGDRRFTPSWGQAKKRAEQEAAFNALRELGVLDEHGTLTMPEPVAAPTDDANDIDPE
jgi:ribonuclease-3